MVRNIICVDCTKKTTERYRLMFRDDVDVTIKPYPGEHVKMLKGEANNLFSCDLCGAKIVRGAICYAKSTWADYGGLPYYEWESEFITLIHDDKGDSNA